VKDSSAFVFCHSLECNTLYGNKKATNSELIYRMKVLNKIEDMKGVEVQTTEGRTDSKVCKKYAGSHTKYSYK
jgi:hypothetical protein